MLHNKISGGSLSDEKFHIIIFRKLPFIILFLSLSMIICLLIISVLVDLYSIKLLPFYELSYNYYPNLFWIYAFTEASIVENFQWLNLILSFIISSVIYYLILNNKLFSPKYWIFFPVGLLILFLEDKYNTRHLVSEIIYSSVAYDYMSLIEYQSSIFGTMIELLIYILYGLIMVIALYKIVTVEKFNKHKKYFISGYFLYAIAAVFSATRHLFDWYHVIGTNILNKIVVRFEVSWSAEDILFQHNSLGFWFMDFVVEESIELIASSLILGGTIHLFYHINQSNSIN